MDLEYLREQAGEIYEVAMAGEPAVALVRLQNVLAEYVEEDLPATETVKPDLLLLQARILHMAGRRPEEEAVLRDVLDRCAASGDPQLGRRLARGWLELISLLMEENRREQAVSASREALGQLRRHLASDEKEFVADTLLRIARTLVDPPPASFRQHASRRERRRFKQAAVILKELNRVSVESGLESRVLAAKVVVTQAVVFSRIGALRGSRRMHEASALGEPAAVAFAEAAERAERRGGVVFRREAAMARFGEAEATAQGGAVDDAIRLFDAFIAKWTSPVSVDRG